MRRATETKRASTLRPVAPGRLRVRRGAADLRHAARIALACLVLACEPAVPGTLAGGLAEGEPLGVGAPASTLPTPRESPHFLRRHAEINALPDRASIELVFLGDSITRRFASEGAYAWRRHYATRRAANFGLDGDRTEHVLWRLENGNLDDLDPKLVVLLIGTNNTHQSPDEEIAAGVLRIVAVLRDVLPRSRILLLGILPKHPDPAHPIRARIRRINAMIAPAGADAMVDYLDIGSVFREPDGSISPSIMPDYLHLSPHAYSLLAEAIEDRVQAALSAPR